MPTRVNAVLVPRGIAAIVRRLVKNQRAVNYEVGS